MDENYVNEYKRQMSLLMDEYNVIVRDRSISIPAKICIMYFFGDVFTQTTDIDSFKSMINSWRGINQDKQKEISGHEDLIKEVRYIYNNHTFRIDYEKVMNKYPYTKKLFHDSEFFAFYHS